MKMHWHRMLGFGIIMLLGMTGFAKESITHQEAQNLFATANAAYRTQEYGVAADAYARLLNAGYDTTPVLYNLGTTSARLGKKGEAVGYLLRARKLNPRDDNIRANLLKVDPPATSDQSGTLGASAETLWMRLINYFTTAEWLAILWVVLLVVCISASILILRLSKKMGTVAKLVLPVSAVILVLLAIPAVAHIYASELNSQAVAIRTSDVLSGPAERFTRIASVKEGEIVRNLRHKVEGYSRVKLANGQQGYISQDHLMEL